MTKRKDDSPPMSVEELARRIMPKGKSAKREIESLDLFPRHEALKRTDDLLRAMLNSPPDPFTPKTKPKKRAKK